ncbi:hypothetical protein PLEOSDRAFT_1097555 [Pleurotus ostreatus PC15]|uniref:Isopenicillin N synthase-like Fe(2+) 2OG dioxygenase domain-containing protein n=1 Tax=Pleurotus ostreatus (strain PC15) TaxID=1137138 RepID=A0A067NFP1_PLEO1|nr:hypothetical protein PLEOSDRAFT_1097555 [Pleurotus ostreatus PC15]
MSLPIIDIAPFLRTSDSSARKATSAEIHDACLRYGFFYLNISAKENVTNGKVDNHEAVDFVCGVEQLEPLCGDNLWPTIPSFKEKYEQWIEKMKVLGLIVMEAVAFGLGMTPDEWQQLRGQVDDGFWGLRTIGSTLCQDIPDHDGFSCGARRFLYSDPTPNALQVFLPKRAAEATASVSSSKDGLPSEEGEEEGVWNTVDPISGCATVPSPMHVANVARFSQVWEIWTDGLYRSTLHRVIHRSCNYRVSIPFFFEPNLAAVIIPLAVAARIKPAQPWASPNGEGKERKPVAYGTYLLVVDSLWGTILNMPTTNKWSLGIWKKPASRSCQRRRLPWPEQVAAVPWGIVRRRLLFDLDTIFTCWCWGGRVRVAVEAN